ncbi:hypothetical protein AKJ09_09324 [Labilithrix luteola]|uniref:Uncharacterized protein n=1 Tax=Labilithrix luteola TaxID=1391654 RepID=A0A0K1QA42_9BACT|nr:hypothetical protein AKJ09_09324 [Labilithrix luteola]
MKGIEGARGTWRLCVHPTCTRTLAAQHRCNVALRVVKQRW